MQNQKRIIPAYAGQISEYTEYYKEYQDHPRIRGTNLKNIWSPTLGLGSSPHTRDKFSDSEMERHEDRIIPAYAGQISSLIPKLTDEEDHPRIRGTNSLFPFPELCFPGSSPHTRDKYVSDRRKCVAIGIIPAYAGQISAIFPPFWIVWDHPRIRGTNSERMTTFRTGTGSSPHTRDK